MAKKLRPDPFSQGSLKEIYKYYVAAFIDMKPQYQGMCEWMETIFDFANRDVIRFTVEKPFKMPGLYLAAPLMPVQGIGYREVKPGAELWVRLDGKSPNKVDVEWLGGHGGKDQVFQLTASEWGLVRLSCRENEKVRKQ